MLLRKVQDFGRLSSVLALVVCVIQPATVTVQDPTAELKFSSANASSISPYVPQRLLSPGWDQVPSVVTCAQRTVSTFPESRGFLYNSTSHLCTPLLWLQGQGAANATAVKSHEGKLYLVNDVCPLDFQLLEYGIRGQLTCVQDHTSSHTYLEATAICNASQSYLVAVKTAEKLALVRAVSGGKDRWVGLDDIVEEGNLVWQIDGANMTEEERTAIFPSHEPNDMRGNEDCVQFRQHTQMLNDKSCAVRHGFICEVSLPGSA
ncbi:hypothetical protein RRG08_026952 [Elysia crispata]|uniref:C-type lectin domain-containing protein n=1 Tax=Elysia crispata TaxID=231223 RepID=A0AAE0YR68_9GAST|nr:hypothetical protein RRG08_026952 [Elysia crispata]